ncbi:hypothetical protein D0Y65_030000, partial [Glycine soja]
YYALDITYFKSSLDSHLLNLLWNNYPVIRKRLQVVVHVLCHCHMIESCCRPVHSNLNR